METIPLNRFKLLQQMFQRNNMKISMKGQTLIEVLVALSVIVILVSMITMVIISSLNNAQFSRDQDLATNYAQEGMEIVRKVRNSNYTSFKNYSGIYCLAKGSLVLPSSSANCTTPNVDKFIRKVQIEQTPGCNTNVAKVTVSVSWTDAKCQTGNLYCHASDLVSCLSSVNPLYL
jgi:type II secretory pathway pseudopilin PulG